jgi:hypothetical protein
MIRIPWRSPIVGANSPINLPCQLYPGNIDSMIVARVVGASPTGSPAVTDALSKPCTAFEGDVLLSSGPLIEVAMAVKKALEQGSEKPVLVFDDATGAVVDLDLRGSEADIIARLSQPATQRSGGVTATAPDPDEPRRRGRPKLGVVAREVTLLPRHWEWLAAQPGGASATLRRFVDEARRSGGDRELKRTSQETAYRFMSALAGDLPGFEEATRALFADDRSRFGVLVAGWPKDVRAYSMRLAFGNLAGR